MKGVIDESPEDNGLPKTNGHLSKPDNIQMEELEDNNNEVIIIIVIL